MFKKMISFVAVAGLVFALAPAAQGGTILLGDPLIPTALGQGDQFRLVFVTNGTTTATSTSITYYNGFVTTAAEATGSVLKDLGVTWTCIGSTSSITAKANTGTIDTAVDPVPIYRSDNAMVATSGAALWDGAIDVPIIYDEFGNNVGTKKVWTGAHKFGGWYSGQNKELGGTAGPIYGWTIGSSWVDANVDPTVGAVHPLYGISDPITIVPEPATMCLLALGGLGLLIRRRRS